MYPDALPMGEEMRRRDESAALVGFSHLCRESHSCVAYPRRACICEQSLCALLQMLPTVECGIFNWDGAVPSHISCPVIAISCFSKGGHTACMEAKCFSDLIHFPGWSLLG